jgi:hypothetical protein
MTCQGWLFFNHQNTSAVFIPDSDAYIDQKQWNWAVLLNSNLKAKFVEQFKPKASTGDALPGFYVDADSTKVRTWLEQHVSVQQL